MCIAKVYSIINPYIVSHSAYSLFGIMEEITAGSGFPFYRSLEHLVNSEHMQARLIK